MIQLVSCMQAAEMVNKHRHCSRQTIHNAIHDTSNGQFESAMKVGRGWALDVKEVEDFIEYYTYDIDNDKPDG